MDVTDVDCLPSPGQIVRILRGRDAGNFAIVVGCQEPYFVLLADGDRRKMECPKKKNVKHIQVTNTINQEIAADLKKYRRVDNAKLRYALNQYLLKQEHKGV
jgi:ribosomal protein L14E/L6E/L27E